MDFSFHFLQALLLFAQVHLLPVASCPPSVGVYFWTRPPSFLLSVHLSPRFSLSTFSPPSPPLCPFYNSNTVVISLLSFSFCFSFAFLSASSVSVWLPPPLHFLSLSSSLYLSQSLFSPQHLCHSLTFIMLPFLIFSITTLPCHISRCLLSLMFSTSLPFLFIYMLFSTFTPSPLASYCPFSLPLSLSFYLYLTVFPSASSGLSTYGLEILDMEPQGSFCSPSVPALKGHYKVYTVNIWISVACTNLL